MYARPPRMLGICATRVVPLPSGASHLPVIVQPAPTANGVRTLSFGLLSLNGAPKKPQTTGPFVAGVTAGPAWMCAAVRLSLGSGVCAPVQSMLDTVTVILRVFNISSSTKEAVPKAAGRAAPPVVVGVMTGGTS